MQRPLAAIEKGSRQKCLLCPIRLVCCGDRRRNASGRLEAIETLEADVFQLTGQVAQCLWPLRGH